MGLFGRDKDGETLRSLLAQLFGGATRTGPFGRNTHRHAYGAARVERRRGRDVEVEQCVRWVGARRCPAYRWRNPPRAAGLLTDTSWHEEEGDAS